MVTPAVPIFSAQVRSLIAPGAEGYLGVLPRHAPLLTALRAGELKVTLADGTTISLLIGGGLMEVVNDCVSVLTDSAKRAENDSPGPVA